jgi:sporulation protein YabP
LPEQKTVKTPHTLVLDNRKVLTATGVSNVNNFDEETVTACTDIGELSVKGAELHIEKLNVETGELTLSGEITSVSYAENRPSGGFFSRLLK